MKGLTYQGLIAIEQSFMSGGGNESYAHSEGSSHPRQFTYDQRHDNQTDQKYQDLLQQVNDIVFRMSLEGILTEVSPSVTGILGYSVDEIVGKDISEYIPPDSMNIIRAEVSRKISNPDETSLYELPIRARNNTMITCEVSSRIIRRPGYPLEIFGIIRDTSERKRMEDALRSSEKKYRELFENAVQGMFRTTPDGQILDVNYSFAKIFGYSEPEELIRYVPDIRQLYLNQTKQDEILFILKRDRIIENAIIEVMDRNGGTRWIRFNARLVPGENGTTIDGSVMDITGEHVLKKSLEEKDQIYRLLADNISDVIWTADMDMNVSYMSPSVKRLRGFTAEEASTQTLSEVYTPESLHSLIINRNQGMKRLQSGDPDSCLPQYLELGMYHRDGHVIWTESVISLIWNDAHEPAGVVGSIRDISSRKQVEQAHRESQDRLREAQKLAQMGNWEINTRTHRIICSDEVHRIFEVEQPDINQTYERFLTCVHPDDCERLTQEYIRCLEENQPGEFITRIVFPDGRIKHLHIRGRGEYSPDGRPERIIGTVQDITDRMTLEEERTNLIKQIQKNIAELSILNDGIRNPLSIIETILERGSEGGREEIEDQIARIDSMVNQLDKRWAESEKIFSYLQKHYGISM